MILIFISDSTYLKEMRIFFKKYAWAREEKKWYAFNTVSWEHQFPVEVSHLQAVLIINSTRVSRLRGVSK